MAEYINREDVLKCLEYNTIQKPSANDVVSATLRVAREKVEKLPVAQEEALFSFWRDPDKDPPKVETEVLILYRNEIDGYGITTAHYEDGSVFSRKKKEKEIHFTSARLIRRTNWARRRFPICFLQVWNRMLRNE